VVPWLGGQSSGGGVVDLGLHALAASAVLHPVPCVATLASHVAGSQVELSRESLPVDVL